MDDVLKKWMEIDYYHMAHRMGFIDKTLLPNHSLILDTIRVLDKETRSMPILIQTKSLPSLHSCGNTLIPVYMISKISY